jgi:hypothetical protein
MAILIFLIWKKKSYPQQCASGKMQKVLVMEVWLPSKMSGFVRLEKPTDLSVESDVAEATMQDNLIKTDFCA